MPLLDVTAKGVFVISATPFTDDGAIDLESLDRATDFYFEKGADGITILGMMGEAPKLTMAESNDVAARAIARAGDRPVIVGCSSPALAAIGELGKSVMDMGAAGIMVAPPGTLKTDGQIVAYYHDVAQALGDGVPIVLQDFPLATNVHIAPEVISRIVADIPDMVMLKHEDWPGLSKITAIRNAEGEGQRRISILCGNGGVFLPEELARGADGAMTGFGYPEMMVEVVALVAKGDKDRAQDIFDAYLPLIRYEQQPGVGLAARKHVLAKRGVIASPMIRPPGRGLSAEAQAEVNRLISRQTLRLNAMA